MTGSALPTLEFLARNQFHLGQLLVQHDLARGLHVIHQQDLIGFGKGVVADPVHRLCLKTGLFPDLARHGHLGRLVPLQESGHERELSLRPGSVPGEQNVSFAVEALDQRADHRNRIPPNDESTPGIATGASCKPTDLDVDQGLTALGTVSPFIRIEAHRHLLACSGQTGARTGTARPATGRAVMVPPPGIEPRSSA